MRKLIYYGGLCLLCSACSVGPDYETPKIYPTAALDKELNIKPAPQITQNWTENLKDAQLNLLIALGLKNNTDVQTAISRLHQARATLRINRVAYLPQADLKGGYNYQKESKNIGMAVDSHYYSTGFDASWELDLWGKGRRQAEADEATLKAMQYTVENTRVAVAAEIASNYISLLQNIENLRFAEQNQILQQKIADSVRAKYQNGLTDEMAYEQSQYLLENTMAQIAAYNTAIENYKNVVATLVGVLPSELPINEHSALLTHKPVDYSSQMNALPSGVVRLRPDVAAAEQQLIAQNAMVGKAVAELYPDVSISGLWGYASRGGRKLIRADSQTYNYAPLVTLPFLDWNKLKNNVRLQEYMREETYYNYKQTVLNALTEIKNAMTAYQNALNGSKHKYQALQNMRTTMRLAQNKYDNGLSEFSDILTTQQNLITAQEDYTASRAEVLQNLIAYYKAVAAPINSN